MAYSAEEMKSRFRLVPASQFSREDLLEYPVWSEFYVPEEREEILDWGIDEAFLDEELRTKDDGSDHAVYPLLETDPFPDRMRVYILARFTTPANRRLFGYIINEDARPAIFIFQGNELFGFNRGMAEWGRRDIQSLQLLLNDRSDPIFPLKYETDFTNLKGDKIEGMFDFDDPPLTSRQLNLP